MNRHEKVLIAEDEAPIALDIKNIVESLGLDVIAIVNNGEDIIKVAEKNTLSLIIADINLKGEIDGIEALSRVREKQSIPFIFITAFRDFERIVEIYNLKPCHMIYKPFDEEALNETIVSCINSIKIE